MNTSTPTNEYMLLFRGPDWDAGLSPEKSEEVLDQVMGWFQRLEHAGKVKGGQPLAREGRTVAGTKGRMVADGPWAESKEAVGGYLTVLVEDLDEAVAIAQSCPTLDYGISIEVRPVLADCPCFRRIKERRELAMA